MRILYSFLFVALSFSYAAAQPLQDFVEQKISHPFLKRAVWGGIAIPVENADGPLFAVLDNTRLTPASTLKLVTTAAALELLGPAYRFETNLYMQGVPNKDGVLAGNIYVQGGGDMTLGSTRVTGAQNWKTVAKRFADVIKSAGVRQIDGDLYADVSLFEGPTVAPKVNWENMGNYYAAPASPLCFNDNAFEIHFAPQTQAGAPVTVDHITPDVPGLHIQSFVTADGKTKKDNAFAYGAPGQFEIKIFGTVPTDKKGFKIKGALPDPALFALQAIKQALEEDGVTLTGDVKTLTQAPNYEGMKKIYTYKSPELKDIVVIINKRSFNLYADMLLRALAVHAGQKGSIENGLSVLKQFLLDNHIAVENDTVLHDGSGLSRDNLITPRVLATTLNYMAKSPNFNYYYNSLATPNDRGDLLVLRKELKKQKRVDDVRVKGGTIDSVKAAAGYVRNSEGKLISYVFMANNLAGKDEALFRIHEDLLKELLK